MCGASAAIGGTRHQHLPRPRQCPSTCSVCALRSTSLWAHGGNSSGFRSRSPSRRTTWPCGVLQMGTLQGPSHSFYRDKNSTWHSLINLTRHRGRRQRTRHAGSECEAGRPESAQQSDPPHEGGELHASESHVSGIRPHDTAERRRAGAVSSASQQCMRSGHARAVFFGRDRVHCMRACINKAP